MRSAFPGDWLKAAGTNLIIATLLLAVTGAAAQQSDQDFALRDGDTVVFFGDSNTEWGTYPKDVENYTLLRFPERRVRFINAGMDGDMASKAFFRMDRDVFSTGATVVFVMFGINDISWGNYAGPEFQKTYLEYIAKIVDECRKHHVRVYVLSYPVTAQPIREKASDPYNRFLGDMSASDTSLLQRLSDDAMKLAREHGAQTIDVEREMRRIRATLPPATRMHQDDGAHLNEFGNEVLAFSILKGLHAPNSVSSVTIDAVRTAVVSSQGASVRAVQRKSDTVSFTRLDRALPLTFGTPAEPAGNASIEKVFEPVNGYFLSVTGLPRRQRFALDVDGSTVSPRCGFSGAQLAGPLNLAAMSSDKWRQRGPWAQQAIALSRVTDSRADLEKALSYPRVNELKGETWSQLRARITPALASAASAQKSIARPVAYHYRVSPLPSDTITACSAARAKPQASK